jgi:RNA polymerase sigma-70 factor (ECF subfamily)
VGGEERIWHDDLALAQAIAAGDEASFVALVSAHQNMLSRLARRWLVESIAEEAVQEAWLVALRSAGRFEGRSSIRSWLCGVLLNVCRARDRIERRTVPASSLVDEAEGDAEPALHPHRFIRSSHHWGGHWRIPPVAWPEPSPEDALLNKELAERIEAAVAQLPPGQRDVFLLRDVEGLSGEEACNVLGIRDTHQRVLLHRARSRIRAALEVYFDQAGGR